MPRKAQKKGDFVTLHPDSENTQKRALQLYGTTTTRGHGNWNAEETYFSTYVPTLNASEGVGNGTTMDNLILNSYRSAQCSSFNLQPSQAMRNGTREKKMSLRLNPQRLGICSKQKTMNVIESGKDNHQCTPAFINHIVLRSEFQKLFLNGPYVSIQQNVCHVVTGSKMLVQLFIFFLFFYFTQEAPSCLSVIRGKS